MDKLVGGLIQPIGKIPPRRLSCVRWGTAFLSPSLTINEISVSGTRSHPLNLDVRVVLLKQGTQGRRPRIPYTAEDFVLMLARRGLVHIDHYLQDRNFMKQR